MLKQTIVPESSTPSVQAFCDDMLPGLVFGFVAVMPEAGAEVDESNLNVERKVARHGGKRVVGWAIRYAPGLFVEALPHVVWQAPDGSVADITPNLNAERKTLFAADANLIYTPFELQFIRRPVDGDTQVAAYLHCFEELQSWMVMRIGAQDAGHDITEEELVAREEILTRMHMLGALLSSRASKYDPYAPCWCGSGKKSKWCHKTAE